MITQRFKKAANEYNYIRLIDLWKPIAYVPSKNNCDTSFSALSDDGSLEKVLFYQLVSVSCYIQILPHIMDSSMVWLVLL